jgi:hypothetical protein
MSKPKKIYISYDGTAVSHKYFDNFVKEFDKNNYLFEFRYPNGKLLRNISISIQSSDLFIAFVTTSYFNSLTAIEELEYAIECKKSILCLLSCALENFSILNVETVDDKTKMIDHYLNLMKAFHTIKLPSEALSTSKWPIELVDEIQDKIEYLIQNNEVAIKNDKYSTNVTSNFQVDELKLINTYGASIWTKKCFGRGVVINQNEIAIIVSEFLPQPHNRIFLFDKDGTLNNCFDAKNLDFTKPTLITVNKISQILIFDNSDGKIKIYKHSNKGLEHVDSIKTNLKDFNDMTVDEDTNDIYFVKCVGNSDIKVICNKTRKIKPVQWAVGELKKDNFKPRFIKVLQNRIFIVNACSFRIDSQTGEIGETTFGESYIYVLDKKTFEVKNLIDFKTYGFYQPWSLIVDIELNIYTTLSQINDRKFISEERYLCKLNRGGDIEGCFKYSPSKLPNDIFYLNEKLMIFNENEINIFSKENIV